MNGRNKAHGWAVFYMSAIISGHAAFGADPIINVDWDEPGDPPALNVDYQVQTTAPASVDYPDVKLITGSLTWRIWSTDTDNPDDIGDIGHITSPYAQNFHVTILDDLDGIGARHVKGIDLDPTDAANHSSLYGAISGDLTEKLFVQKSSGGSGGSLYVAILGDAEGDITADTISLLYIGGELSGDVAVDDVTGTMSVTDDLTGDFTAVR